MPPAGGRDGERYYTVREAAEGYFQGKVSAREVYLLFARGDLLGFRLGSARGKILIYASSLEAFRVGRENAPPARPAAPPPPAAPRPKRRKPEEPPVRLTRLPAD